MSLNQIKKEYDEFSMYLKAYQILREGLKISKEELDELILFFSQIEEYEICERLKKY